MKGSDDNRLQAALLRVSMELRTRAGCSLPDATDKVAHCMCLDPGELGRYLRSHLTQLMSVTQHDLVCEKTPRHSPGTCRYQNQSKKKEST